MAYGDRRDYPKIDLYVRSPRWREGEVTDKYVGSTTWARTLKEAKAHFRSDSFVAGRGQVDLHPDDKVLAYYSEPRKTRARRSR